MRSAVCSFIATSTNFPGTASSEREHAYSGAVHEQLDWVDERPDTQSRQPGWIDFEEFKTWLRIHRDAFRDL
jgi:hypothetical protein